MNGLNQTDIEFALLGGLPVCINGLNVYPITFNQIAEIGYSNYNQALNIFCVGLKQLLNQDVEDKYLYEYLCAGSYDSIEICNSILLILELITRENTIFDEESRVFIFRKTVFDKELNSDKIIETALDSDTFLEIQNIVRIRNGLKNIKEDIENPSNEKARQLLEKRKKYRLKLRDVKSNSENITIVDLISILANGLHLELSKVYEYDVYQLNDQINRLKIFKDYDINIQALLHGANSEEIEIRHWLCNSDINPNSSDDEE